MEIFLYLILTIALLVLSVIDIRTHKIPNEINYLILVLGLIHVVLDNQNWREYVSGFFMISGPLALLLLLSKGKVIGGGDVKLMAVAGLMLGCKKIVLAFLIGCMVGSVIHIVRMKVAGAGRVFAMGPYLSLGIWVSMLWGNSLIAWYQNQMF